MKFRAVLFAGACLYTLSIAASATDMGQVYYRYAAPDATRLRRAFDDLLFQYAYDVAPTGLNLSTRVATSFPAHTIIRVENGEIRVCDDRECITGG